MPELTLQYQPLDSFTVTSEYTNKRYARKNGEDLVRPHNGVDLRARKPGSKLYNAHDGTVILSEYSPTYGNVIVIQDSASGYSTLYAHLTERNVNVGDTVTDRTLIGKTGNSGPTGTQYHLHFEIIDDITSAKIANGGKLGDSGIYGKGRENPRPFLASAFPDTFSTTVDSSERIYDIEGDSRDNSMIANARSNHLNGLEGDDTYVIPSFSGDDVIIDPDLDGTISIEGHNLSGNAIPYTDPDTGSIIPDKWTLADYTLIKDGNDLTIFKSGRRSQGSVTIKDFPFDSVYRTFGFTINKEISSSLGFSRSYVDDELANSIVFASSDRRGRFFAPAFVSKSGQPDNYAIKVFDANGKTIGYNYFTNIENTDDGTDVTTRFVSSIGRSYRLDNDDVVFIYAINEQTLTNGAFSLGKSSAYLARTNSKGEIISNSKVAESSTTDSVIYSYRKYSPSFVTRKGMCFSLGGNPSYCGTLDEGSISYVNDKSPYYDVGQDHVSATLVTGDFMELNHGPTTTGVTILKPRFIESTTEATPNYEVSGDYDTDSTLKSSVITVSYDEETTVNVTQNSNSVTIINGFDDNQKAKLVLPAFSIESGVSIFELKESDYFMSELLKGDFKSNKDLLKTSLDRRRLEEVDDFLSRNATDDYYNTTDDYYNNGGNATVPDDSYPGNIDRISTVITLPNNQTVILMGVNASRVAEYPTQYFLTQDQLTGDPSLSPSTSPTLYPSLAPSQYTSNPPLQPSTIPTAYEDTTLPAYPTFQPTRLGNSSENNSGNNIPINAAIGVIGGIATVIGLGWAWKNFRRSTKTDDTVEITLRDSYRYQGAQEVRLDDFADEGNPQNTIEDGDEDKTQVPNKEVNSNKSAIQLSQTNHRGSRI